MLLDTIGFLCISNHFHYYLVNNITNVGAHVLAESLKQNATLTELDLRGTYGESQ